MPENIILTGFMATGKTTVGKALAGMLHRAYVDMDAIIEERSGKSIDQIFREDGEDAFRALESQLCVELCKQSNLVIATGGGTLVDPSNRNMMEKNGTLICLSAETDIILQRLAKGDGFQRPLLNTPDPRSGIERLMSVRDKSYQAVPWHIDTSYLSVEEVINRILSICQSVQIDVKYPGGEYPILIGNGLLENCGDILHQAGIEADTHIAIVSNPVVEPLYAARVKQSLKDRGIKCTICLIPDGEEHKTLDSISSLYDQFLATGLQRQGKILALGGGVIGDVAGFAAATYLRGLGFVQIPTTLLAMVDSSIGGKTGVDLPQGKNLAGAFKQPLMVLIDPVVLRTLPEGELRSGMAEVIKHGVIADPDLLNLVESRAGMWDFIRDNRGAETIIAKAIRVKKTIVEADPFEMDRRALLNFGHTLGHAIEKLSSYRIRHGEGVSIGMMAAARISAKMKFCNPDLAARLEKILISWELPVRIPNYPAEDLLQAMSHDKKKQGNSIRWVLPHEFGDVRIHTDIPLDQVIQTIIEMGGE
jgi:shikimate kinase / 3-dehydroquinate synthase